MRELLGVFIFISLVWLHYRAVEESFLKSFYFPSIMLKLVAGAAVGLLYTHYYSGGDTWSYFNQAKQFAEVGFANYSNFANLFFKSNYGLVDGFVYVNQPRAALMVKLVAIINLLSNSNYWITSFYFSFFSFIGVYKFATWVATRFEYGKVAALAIFIWPSFVFWSSGILKEALAVGLIFWIIATFFEAKQTRSINKVVQVLLGLYFLFLIKYYFAVVLFVILLLYSVSLAIKLDKKSPFYQIFIWLLMAIIGFGLGGLLHTNLRFDNISGVMIENNLAFSSISSSQSLISFLKAGQNWVWVIINTPKAIFAGLFLPILPSGSLMLSLAAIENWFLIALLVRGLFFLKVAGLKKDFLVVLASVSYILILSVFLSLSTPNLGTLSRYKVAFIPIVILLIVLANRFTFLEEK